MNYVKLYNSLCDNAKGRSVPGGYIEKHRILPGCMGGKYTTHNTVILTGKEHYIAHWLLTKLHPKNNDLVYSFFFMNTRKNKNQLERYSSPTGLKSATKLFCKMMSKKMAVVNKGKNNPMYGRAITYTDKHLVKLSKLGNSVEELKYNIRKIYVDKRQNSEIAKDYGIDHAHVWRIKNDKSFKRFTKDLIPHKFTVTAGKNNFASKPFYDHNGKLWYSIKQCSEELGIPKGTIWNRLERSKKKLSSGKGFKYKN